MPSDLARGAPVVEVGLEAHPVAVEPQERHHLDRPLLADVLGAVDRRILHRRAHHVVQRQAAVVGPELVGHELEVVPLGEAGWRRRPGSPATPRTSRWRRRGARRRASSAPPARRGHRSSTRRRVSWRSLCARRSWADNTPGYAPPVDESDGRLLSLDGKVALVTGAATGIGEAIAGVLAAAGAHVLVADIDEAGAERVVGRRSVSSIGAPTASTSTSPTRRRPGTAIEAGIEAGGGLDVLVNNAGSYHESGASSTRPTSRGSGRSPSTTRASSLPKPAAEHMVARGGGARS